MNDKGKVAFERIVASMSASEEDVEPGRMMSSPGLKCRDRVFAFLAKEGMGFRLGPDFDPKAFGVKRAAPLNPFKTKGPLKGWFTVGPEERGAWEALATSALTFTRTLNK